MERRYSQGTTETLVRVDPEGDAYRVTVGDKSYTVAVRRDDQGVLMLDIDGQRAQAVVAADGLRRWVALDGVAYVLEPGTGRRGKHHAGEGEETLTAQMPGQVVAVHVQPGDHVERGQKLLALEAMKMELQVTAPHAGRVKSVKVKASDVVKRGQVLVELDTGL